LSLLLPWCFTSTETIRLIRDGEWERRWSGVGEGRDESLVEALRPAKPEETVSHCRNNDVKEVGTPGKQTAVL